MTNDTLKKQVVENLCKLHDLGWNVVIVHGGGPFINRLLEKVGVLSEFIAGHRKTTDEAIEYIEMALMGQVNSNLVSITNALGKKAIGLSGKDGQTVKAKKRIHIEGDLEIDLGRVGEVVVVNPALLHLLLSNNYLPIVACIGGDDHSNSLNINADMMAGAIAGALKADIYCVLTDVDGLQRDKDRPETLIASISYEETEQMIGSIIVGGMIPKIESCRIALDEGAAKAMIINGTKPEMISESLIENKTLGTTIYKS